MNSPVFRIPALFVLIGASFLLADCQTVSKTEYQARVDELAQAQMELDTLRSQYTLQTEALTAKDSQLGGLENRNRTQEARIKELESTVTRLEDLLNDLQSMQLDLMMPKPSPTLQMTAGTDSAVVAAPVDATPPSTNTAPANPASGPVPPMTLVPARVETVPIALDVPPDAPVIVKPATTKHAPLNTERLVTATPRKASLGKPGIGLGQEVLPRGERTKIKGTPLFSERDSSNGRFYYYHQDAWYDQAGLFMEFSRSGGGPYSARLLIQIRDPKPLALPEACVVSLAGIYRGIARDARVLRDGQDSYQYVALDYDTDLIAALRQSLDAGNLSVAIAHPDGSVSDTFIPDLVMRQALRDMIEAREDLR